MNGSFYILTSYTFVCGLLFILWLKPWRKWRDYLKKHISYE